jgi:hypothetical protein
MKPCSQRQEMIARGEVLSSEDRRHLRSCPACAGVAMAYSILDQTLDALAPDVPAGFADRVMTRLQDEDTRAVRRWFERPWIQLALAHAGALCAAVNVARFLARVLFPSVASGGMP